MEQIAWNFAFPLAILFVGTLTVLVATIPLAWWLKGRSRPSSGVAVVASGGIAGVAVAFGVLLPIMVGLGDGPSNDSLHLVNSSDSELFLVQPRRESIGRSTARYSPLSPDDSTSLGRQYYLRGIRGYCTAIDSNRLIRLTTDHEWARYIDPVSGQMVTEDPDPSIVIEVGAVPGGWCFSEPSAWIEWDGRAFTRTDSRHIGWVTQIAIGASIPIGIVLALGAGLDALLARHRRSRLDEGGGPGPSGPKAVA